MLKLRMIIRIFFTLVINLFLVSCSKEDQLSEKDLWHSLNIDNYEMTQQISCFCYPYEFVLPKSIKVENDKIGKKNSFEEETIVP